MCLQNQKRKETKTMALNLEYINFRPNLVSSEMELLDATYKIRSKINIL